MGYSKAVASAPTWVAVVDPHTHPPCATELRDWGISVFYPFNIMGFVFAVLYQLNRRGISAFSVDLRNGMLIWDRIIWYNYIQLVLQPDTCLMGLEYLGILKWGIVLPDTGQVHQTISFFYSGCDARTTQSRIYSVFHWPHCWGWGSYRRSSSLCCWTHRVGYTWLLIVEFNFWWKVRGHVKKIGGGGRLHGN